jgi:formate/nitrite transporter FocA (FNT family)
MSPDQERDGTNNEAAPAEPRCDDVSEPIKGMTAREIVDIEERAQPRSPVIYEIIRRMGEEEMARPLASLWWSGVAAGLSISFSMIVQAVLQVHLPDTDWRPLVAALGYTTGFLMVVLSRQQLFTENTITVVLPAMKRMSMAGLGRLARLWSVVFAANMAGAWLAAFFFAHTPALAPELRAGAVEIGLELMRNGWGEMFVKAIVAGFLIAAMVWMVPNADAAKFHVILFMTYLIAVGGFTHIVAGSVETFFLVESGEIGLGAMTFDFAVPVLLGNIVGGTALFALLSHAQVINEL